jgi:hypothetical protein
MELDDLKAAWQTLDRRLDAQSALNLHIFRDGKLDKARRGLRPLFVGQLLQMAFGLAFILLAGLLWSGKPDAVSVILAGITLHAYGVACIIAAGITLGRIQHIDYSSAVVDIQKQLAGLRTSYIYSGMIAGLPWWFLWVPILMVLSGLSGVNLYVQAPDLVWTGLGIGAAGLLGTWWFHRWSRHPSRPRMAQMMEDSVAGTGLKKAQSVLDEIARFEQN